MLSKTKSTLIAGAVALVATFGAVQAAQAGGHHLFAPYGAYLPGSYDEDSDYGCDDCSYATSGYLGGDDELGDAVSAASSIARQTLGVDVEDVLDDVAE